MTTEIETEAGRILADRGMTLAVAESCTGGLVGYRLTSVSGSSRYFLGGVLAYCDAVKSRELDVDMKLLRRVGAVSAEVAKAMAQGVRERFHADIGLSLTGVAGPDGGTDEKPVGLVFIGVAGEGWCEVKENRFDGDRETVRRSASASALVLLVESLRAGRG